MSNKERRMANHTFCAVLNIVTLCMLALTALLDALAAAAW